MASTRGRCGGCSESTHRTRSRSSKRFPPLDLSGQVIPQSQRWGYSTPATANANIRSMTANAVLITTFISFNSSTMGRKFYDELDRAYGEFNMNLWGTFIITSVFFWVWGAIFAIPDLTGWPRWLSKYKTQPFKRVDGPQYLSIAAVSLRNQLFVALPMIILNALVCPLKPVNSTALPGPLQTVATIVFDVFCTEVGFYYSHRAFHSKWLYALFHKQHHTYTAPVGLASTYCTTTEHIFSNILPTLLGTIIVPHHWSELLFTYLFLEFGTICSHSGYNIPWMSSNLQHDFHHFAFDENFGTIGLLDTLHHTNTKFTRTMRDAKLRTGGDEEKARELVLHRLATIDSEEQCHTLR